MHATRDRPEAAERHGAGHVARCTARAAHGRPGPARHPPHQVPAHHAQRTARAVPGRPGQAPLRGLRPGGLWVADIPPQAGGTPSYVRAFSGWVYAAFVTDVYPRRIIGWQTTYRPVCTDLALDALKMAVWQRKRTGADHLTGLVHHLRPRRAVQVYSLRASPIRGRGSRLGGFQGRPLPASPWPRHSSSLYKAELIP